MVAPPIMQAAGLTVEEGGTTILDGISLTIERGISRLIQGPSGSGKTTLFRVLALLAPPTAGRLEVNGVNVADIAERKRARIRRDTVGIVFQDFQLIPDLTAWENAAVPQAHGSSRDESWLNELFETMDITPLKDRYPATLSGGEKQRVAIARALANKPEVILADEPTGQLDPETAASVLDLLRTMHETADSALIVISHDRQLATTFDEVSYLSEGEIQDQEQIDRQPLSEV